MKSSMGIVYRRMPRFSASLYRTTGSEIPVPVRIPFTIRGVYDASYVPCGWLRFIVKMKLRKIFEFRFNKIEILFGKWENKKINSIESEENLSIKPDRIALPS